MVSQSSVFDCALFADLLLFGLSRIGLSAKGSFGIHIAFITYDSPRNICGPTVNIHRLLPELVKRGHRVAALVFHQGGGTPNADYLQRYGVQVFRRTWHSTSSDKVRWVLKALQQLDVDIFVPNISAVGWYAARWARYAGVPTIATYRSDDAFHGALVNEFVTGDPAWAVSGLVCVSESLARRVVERRPASTEVCVIPSGVPISGFTTHFQRPLRIAYVGRMQDEQKQVNKTLDALIDCVRRGLPIENVSFIGEGPQRRELERRVASLGLKGIFEFVGHIPPERIQEKLASFQVLVLLSDYEGIPGAVMDAMACGVVPICTRLPGLEELVIDGKTGLLVDDRGESFQRAVSSLAGSQTFWQSLSDAAAERVRDSYSLDVCCQRWDEFAERLVQQAGRKRTIEIPRKIELPELHPDFAREDFRARHPRLYLRRAFDLGLALKNRFTTPPSST